MQNVKSLVIITFVINVSSCYTCIRLTCTKVYLEYNSGSKVPECLGDSKCQCASECYYQSKVIKHRGKNVLIPSSSLSSVALSASSLSSDSKSFP